MVTRDVGGELMAYVIGRGIGGGSRNPHGSAKVVDSEGKALLDVNALRALLRLLRLAQVTPPCPLAILQSRSLAILR